MIIEDGLNNYLKDNRMAWELQADGIWVQCLNPIKLFILPSNISWIV
ncbi:hypothetical protein F889_00921 [Acinetobacter colistiniresistens]|uniref:Uncharacterized protein n=1 Tax=Acinetobacter colistiniresistens TaxID=280145 RepID=N9PNY7_9GAMM|nr:hypothetical protein F889_00921 [Acinetobacter colistiniresistens]